MTGRQNQYELAAVRRPVLEDDFLSGLRDAVVVRQVFVVDSDSSGRRITGVADLLHGGYLLD